MKRIALLILLVITIPFSFAATYVIHNTITGVMHQSKDIYSQTGIPVETELGTIEAKLSEYGTAVDSIEIALSSSGSLPVRVDSIETVLFGFPQLGGNQTWTGNNVFTTLVDGTASVAIYAPNAGDANYSLTAGTSAVALIAINADNANLATTAIEAQKITGNAYISKVIQGSGITVTSGADSREVTIAATGTGTISRVYANTDGTYSDGPNVSLVSGKNITVTRTGDSFEVKVNSPIEEESINVTNANLADTEYSGFTLVDTMAASCSVYDILYKSSSGWNKAKADADSTLPAFGMCLETGTGERKLLLRGCVRNNSWNWTEGALIYVDVSTAGAITSTKPSSTGNRIQIVGVALDADTIYFNPDSTWIEI